jgi:hypothetical protein
MTTNWLVCIIVPLKKLVHSGWEYNRVQDPTQETSSNLGATRMVELLQEMFQNINNWPTPK